MSELDWLVEVSKNLGSDAELVQGTGGNISVKTGSKMYIKSSGVRLDSVSQDAGYSVVNHEEIVSIYSRDVDEGEADMIVASSVEQGGRPSIETGFHSFLGKYVIHLHMASLNAILCSAGSRNLLGEIFCDMDHLWVPYVKVGHLLAREIMKNHPAEESVIFLENHGIIVSSEAPAACVGKINLIRSRAAGYLKARIPGYREFEYKPPAKSGAAVNHSPEVLNTWSGGKFLFPDAAVFSVSEKIRPVNSGLCYSTDYGSAVNIDEVLSVHARINGMIKNFSSPKYLTEREIADILGMESEKYRRRLMGI